MIWTVKRLTNELNISKATVNRFVNRFKKELTPFIKYGKRNRVELTEEGKNRLINLIKSETGKNCGSIQNNSETIHDSNVESVKKTFQHLNHEPIYKESNNKYKIEALTGELKEKNEIINKLIQTNAETINKLIDRQADSEEKLQTIIMKLTQDLEQVRNENRLLLEENKKKDEPKKTESQKTDRVISIQEFINTKVEEDIQRSELEAKKRRLEKKCDNPLQGRSALYRLYIKIFRPEMLRDTFLMN